MHVVGIDVSAHELSVVIRKQGKAGKARIYI